MVALAVVVAKESEVVTLFDFAVLSLNSNTTPERLFSVRCILPDMIRGRLFNDRIVKGKTLLITNVYKSEIMSVSVL